MDLAYESILAAIEKSCLDHVTMDQGSAKRFFKTGEGSYAEGDRFLGITVPDVRKIAKNYAKLDLIVLEKLLSSVYNEVRLLALIILVQQYQRGEKSFQNVIYDFYLKNVININNWNLVDSSAHHIVGHYHYTYSKKGDILFDFAVSDNLWKRRIAIIATWYNIRQNDISLTIELSRILLHDKHDLIHKAVGWMLREAGKKDENVIVNFLLQNASKMPKTMLRYALERLSDQNKQLIKNSIL